MSRFLQDTHSTSNGSFGLGFTASRRESRSTGASAIMFQQTLQRTAQQAVVAIIDLCDALRKVCVHSFSRTPRRGQHLQQAPMAVQWDQVDLVAADHRSLSRCVSSSGGRLSSCSLASRMRSSFSNCTSVEESFSAATLLHRSFIC